MKIEKLFYLFNFLNLYFFLFSLEKNLLNEFDIFKNIIALKIKSF